MNREKLTAQQTSFHIYISIVLLCIIPTLDGAHIYSFENKKQADFVKSLEDYEVALPSRVTRSGTFISHDIYPNHVRVKRSSGVEQMDQDDVHYKLNIGNDNLHLQLKPNYKLYNSLLVLEHRKNSFKNVTDSTFSRYRYIHEHCHFIGEVKGQPNSKVALELCNGLRGLIHTNKSAYFIEPIQGYKSTNTTGHPHIIYQHTSLPSLPGQRPDIPEETHKKDSCGVDDDKTVRTIEENRERWQKHHDKKHQQHRRHKRSISVERHVETLVVVDPEMMEYYKNEDVTTYVLTVMNMVASLYHDASIGNAINIVVVRIILLEEHQDNLVITHHADKSLRSFCKWQTKINMKEEEHPNHHDVAVLLTRKNICARVNKPCSTLGLAQTNGMCQPHRSCNINEDTGIALAYTVAHELGHNLGMRHDGKRNGCELRNKDEFMYVMSGHLMAVSPLMKWSNCSKNSITKFIDRGWAYCLDDEPVKYRENTYEYPMLPPGIMYDGDHQCRLAYGPEAHLCEGGRDDICNTLWCRTNNKCSTKLEAAAEGTICGQNKWCFGEQCVEIGERPQAINGNWGEWSDWSVCSRTCGAGVSSTERHCDNPQPSNGGKYCIGERKRYRICNTDPCPEGVPNFRKVQCEEFNYIPFKNGLYKWEEVNTPDTPCQLHCKPKNKFFSVMLRDIVTDGTPCTPGTRNMCISGRCRHVGCDWQIDSSAREDHCGVCHGDGSTCETIKDQYNETQGFGYVEATVIPKDARNIIVEELEAANNYLAVQNDKGEYYLNGHWFIQWSGDYDMAGTVMHYKRVGNKERFEAVGPLKEPLHIMLLLQSHNPGVMFQYTVPKLNATDTRPRHFIWKYMDWTHCTSSCGGGTQRAEVVCVEKEAGTVDDSYCNSTTKPDDQQRACNVHLCPARWWSGPWQHCSVSCGDNGVHRRTVICVRSLGSDEQIALEDKSCDGKEKPTEVEKCHHKKLCPGTARWITGDWSDCDSNPCSQRSRSVTCEEPQTGCDKTPKPQNSKACSNIKCGEWTIEKWSKCSSTCGTGVRHRVITCKGSSVCNNDNKPTSEEACNKGDCPITTTVIYPTTEAANIMTTVDIYNIAEETDISSRKDTAVGGNLKKPHSSDSKVEMQNKLIEEDKEPINNLQSTVTEEITLGNQTFEIEEGGTEERQTMEEKDSVSTDDGNKQGEIKNTNSVNSKSTTKVRNPTTTQRPVNQQTKKMSNEQDNKNEEKKSKHRRKHGHKKKNRGENAQSGKKNKNDNTPLVKESRKDYTPPVKNNKSDQTPQLKEYREDSSPPLKTNRNNNAMPVTNSRENNTPQLKKNKDVNTPPLKKNKDDNTPPVPLSDITRLSRIRSGRIGSLLPPKEPPPMSMDTIMKNSLRKTSFPGGIVASVYEWSPRNWTECTRQCGGGVQTRPILCVNSKSNEEVSSQNCNILTKPNAIRPCNSQKCAQWQTTDWSSCSATCGLAVQNRKVSCPDNSFCDPKHRPTRIRTCKMPDCLAWIHGQWSKCSKSCGTGQQVRVVQCVNITSQKQTSGCDLNMKPDEQQACNKEACPDNNSEFQRSVCKSNRMSDRVCHLLKKRGHCLRLFVRINCCRECELDKLKRHRSRKHVQR